MARKSDDDLGPALLALGALALGIVAIVALWGVRGPTSEHGRAARERRIEEARLDYAARAATFTDGGVAWAPLNPSALANTERYAPLDEEIDPQIVAMRRSYSSGGDAGTRGFDPYRSTGHAVVVEGIPGVRRDATCDVRVLPVSSYDDRFNCVVRVRCGGVVVYPDGELIAGYAPCEVERGVPRLATDEASTLRDGDPELFVDLDAHIARVRDRREGMGGDSYVEIRLD